MVTMNHMFGVTKLLTPAQSQEMWCRIRLSMEAGRSHETKKHIVDAVGSNAAAKIFAEPDQRTYQA
jgi:5-carboxymethyl-2-hydroxymuconate isomerase